MAGFCYINVFSNSNDSVILYSLQGVVAAHTNFSRREGHTHIQQSGLSSSAQATGCPTRTKEKYLRVVNSHSHHHPKSLFNQFPHKEKLKFITITKSSPVFPHEGKFVRDLLKAWLGRQIWNKKNPRTHSEYTVLHETPIWEVKNFINLFREKRHIYHPAPHVHGNLQRAGHQGLSISFYHLLVCWAVKMANYLQNYQAPSVPQHFSREITWVEIQMSPRLSSSAWKAFSCLTWVQTTALPRATQRTKTLTWSSRHLLRHLKGILLTSKGELHSPKSVSQSSKAESLLKLTLRLFVWLTKSFPCKNKQKMPHEGKTEGF